MNNSNKDKNSKNKTNSSVNIESILEPLPLNSIDKEKDIEVSGCFIKEGKYCTITKNKVVYLSNFTMKFLFHFIDGSQNTKRLILLQRYTGEQSVIEVFNSDLKGDHFETILKSYDCTFLGNSYQLKLIFSSLMDNQKVANVINTLGYSPYFEMYCFSNGLYYNNELVYCNQIGIIEDKGETFYLPASSELNMEDDPDKNDPYKDHRKFKYIAGHLSFSEWSELIYKAYEINGGITICFIINSVFRDIVFKELGFFPFLFLFGQPGVGKTTLIDGSLKLFGENLNGLSIKNSTTKAIARSCSQRRNALVFLKEYDSNLDKEKIGFFKNGYDGVLYSIAQRSQDKKTIDYEMESGIIIDANVLPTSESALFDRFIVLLFSAQNFTKESTEAYQKLVEEFDKGLGKVLLEILNHREFFKKNFRLGYREVYNQLKNDDINFEGVDIGKLPERNIKHIAFLLSPYRILHDKLKFPFSFEELTLKVLKYAIEKNEQLSSLKDTNIFFDAINYDRSSDFPKVKFMEHYVKDEDSSIVYLKYDTIFPIYVDYCRKLNINDIDSRSMLALLTSLECFLPTHLKGRGKSHIKKPIGSCYQFKYMKTENEDYILINNKEVKL